MKIHIMPIRAFVVLLLISCATIPARAVAKPIFDIDSANRQLARTINIAFTLDAPQEGKWGHTLKAEEFKVIRDAGFTAVRLPVQWVTRMDSIAPYQIHPKFLKRVDWAIAQCEKNHLAIVLDNHLDEQLMNDPAKYHDRYLALWQQLAKHYRKYPQTVMFEVMAEPHGKLSKLWSAYFNEALTIIRQSNPTRPVIVGSNVYNTCYAVGSLNLPEKDRYLIVTFHYYHPVKFTMQGEAWFTFGKPMEWIGTQWTGSDTEKQEINASMDMVAQWAEKNRRPVFLGEFGAGNSADTASKARYFTYMRQQAELRHFSWGIFNFSNGLAIYDLGKQQWHEDLLHALIPK